LISTWRGEILQYLAEHQISFVSDQSNLDTTFFRNRLRHELLPYLEKYNPRIRENLLRMSQINKEDYEVIQQQVIEAWQANFIQQGPGYVAFRLPGFQRLPAAIQRYMLRKAVAYHLPSLRDIDFESIERGIRYLCDGQKRGQADLIAGLRLVKEEGIFWLATWQADLPASNYPSIAPREVLTLEIPSIMQLANGWKLQAVKETNPEQAIQESSANQDPFQAWLDMDKLILPLLIRPRKSGERFQPLGMKGHSQKITDMMVNLKMPQRARSTWPLLCSGEDILWIPGYRQSHQGRVHPGSQQIVHLIFTRGSST